MEAHTNWLALVAAVVATQLLGFIWYNPKVFGSIWQQELGMDADKAKGSNMALKPLLGAILMFGVAYALKYVAHGEVEFATFKHGAYHAGMDGLLIVVPIIGTCTLYENKSIKYFAITAGYWLLSFVLIGGIISWWR